MYVKQPIMLSLMDGVMSEKSYFINIIAVNNISSSLTIIMTLTWLKTVEFFNYH